MLWVICLIRNKYPGYVENFIFNNNKKKLSKNVLKTWITIFIKNFNEVDQRTNKQWKYTKYSQQLAILVTGYRGNWTFLWWKRKWERQHSFWWQMVAAVSNLETALLEKWKWGLVTKVKIRFRHGDIYLVSQLSGSEAQDQLWLHRELNTQFGVKKRDRQMKKMERRKCIISFMLTSA